MKKLRKRLSYMARSIHYFLTCLELNAWKTKADWGYFIKKHRRPRRHTCEELSEASRLLKTWMDQESHKGNIENEER